MKMLAIVTYLAAHGCGLPCSAGLLANFVTEAGPSLDPCIINQVQAGLAQWQGARRRRLFATLGNRWCQIDAQLGFVFTELREMGVLDRLLRATDPGEAARMFMLDFERPRNRNPGGRMAKARDIYRELQAEGVR